MAKCLSAWKAITAATCTPSSQQWLLDGLTHGFRLPTPEPHETFVRANKPGTRKYAAFVAETLATYERLGIVRRCPRRWLRGLMPMDVVKQSNGLRMVLDGSPLNDRVEEPEPFSYEDVRHLSTHLAPGDWMAKADISKLYLNIPIHRSVSRWCGVEWEGTTWCFVGLPLGLSHAPRLATLVVRPLVALLRQAGIRLSQYLDDGIVTAQTREQAVQHFQLYCQLFARAGLVLHPDKCSREPTNFIEFLGFNVDTTAMTIGVTARKKAAYVQQARRLMAAQAKAQPVAIKKLARWVGSIVSTMMAFRPALALLAHTNALVAQTARERGWRAQVLLPPEVSEECRAIRRLLASGLWTCQPIRSHQPAEVVLTTDASSAMWGAFLSEPTRLEVPTSDTHQAQWPTQTLWSDAVPRASTLVQFANSRALPAPQWATHAAPIFDRAFAARLREAGHRGATLNPQEVGASHNNILETLAILFAIARFMEQIRGRRLHIRSDNTAALAACRRAHSPASTTLGELGLKINLLLACLHAELVATTHLPGVLNTRADEASRRWLRKHKRLEWPISGTWLKTACAELEMEMPEIDAFATAANTKCPRFFSLHHDPLAEGTDAMAQPWAGRRLLLNPPFAMFPKVVAKMHNDMPRQALVVAPEWPNTQWYQTLRSWASHSVLVPPQAIDSGPNWSEALLNPAWRLRAMRVDAQASLSTSTPRLCTDCGASSRASPSPSTS